MPSRLTSIHRDDPTLKWKSVNNWVEMCVFFLGISVWCICHTRIRKCINRKMDTFFRLLMFSFVKYFNIILPSLSCLRNMAIEKVAVKSHSFELVLRFVWIYLCFICSTREIYFSTNAIRIMLRPIFFRKIFHLFSFFELTRTVSHSNWTWKQMIN